VFPREQHQPPIPRVIQSLPVKHGFDQSGNSSTEVSRARGESAWVEEDWAHTANVTCMNTMFGSSVKGHSGPGIITCNQVGPSTTEVELNIKLPSFYADHMDPSAQAVAAANAKICEVNHSGLGKARNVMSALHCRGPQGPAKLDETSRVISTDTISGNTMNSFHCSGVRGPGKKFDYSCNPKIGQFSRTVPSVSTPNDLDDKVTSFHDSFEEKSYVVDTNMFTEKQKKKSIRKLQKLNAIVDSDARAHKKAVKSIGKASKKDIKSKLSKLKSSSEERGFPSSSRPYDSKIIHPVKPNNLSEKDQAELARNIREICLQATPELNIDEYPSFDEPQPDNGLAELIHQISLGASSSGTENKSKVANKQRIKPQEKTNQNLPKNKEKVEETQISKDRYQPKRIISRYDPSTYDDPIPDDEKTLVIEDVASC
jgi:hypothetical protein